MGYGTGGGICCFSSRATIINNVIACNTASEVGGGIRCNSSDLTITNNTIVGNSASTGVAGAVWCTGTPFPGYSELWITNTIIWDNGTSQQIRLFCQQGEPMGVQAGVYHSDIQGGEGAIEKVDNSTNGFISLDYPGTNIDADPLFADAEWYDYHLSDRSPCIGAGTSVGALSSDIAGNPRPDPPGSDPDMGAYESSLAQREPL